MEFRLKLFILLLALPHLLLVVLVSHVQLAATGELNGALVFSDDFNGDSLRKYFWESEDGCQEVRHLNMQQECFLKADNLQVANGTLILRAGITHFDDNVMFTSARVRGSGFGFTYGTMMIRARLPAGKHLAPSFYLLPIHQHYDRCKYEEIDIMEARGERTSSLVFSTKFGKTYEELYTRSIEKSFAGVDFSKDFHVFAIKWMPTRIEWYVDGLKVHEVNTHFISDWTNGKTEHLPCWKNRQPPFGDKSSIFISLSVGGKLFPDSKFGNLTEEEAQEWAKPSMEIDWIRIYNNEDDRNGIAPSLIESEILTTSTKKSVLLIDYTNTMSGNVTQNIVVRDYLAPFIA